MTTRISRRLQTGLGGADQDAPALLAPEHLVFGCFADAVDVCRVELEVAALATALVQRRRADARGRRTQLVVQRHELGRQTRNRLRTLGAGLLRLGGDLRESGVAALFGFGDRAGQLLAFVAELGKPRLHE